MPRTPVIDSIAAILADAPRLPSGSPQTRGTRDLAEEVYGTDAPTAAQLSAVRRAVARLVADGRAKRDPEREPSWGSGGYHLRQRVVNRGMETEHTVTYRYANPSGVRVRRPMTAADHEARAAVVARFNLREDDRIIERNR